MLRPQQTLTALMLMLAAMSCRQGECRQHRAAGGSTDSLVILLTGDVLLDRGVRQQALRYGGWQWLFSGTDSLFRTADATVINLECPLTETATPLGKRFIFRADTATASVMRRAGITHATLANNHTNDQGTQGLRSTVAALRRAGITPMGCSNDDTGSNTAVLRPSGAPQQHIAPTLISKGSITAALFCAVLFPLENWMPRPGCITPCQTDAASLARAIRAYRRAHPAHRIVCVLHWGIEYQQQATPLQRRQARTLISAGADAIVGHHPHVVQPPLPRDPVPVLYSLGNFIFDQRTPATTRASVARLVLRPDTLTATAIPVCIKNCRPEPSKIPTLKRPEPR